jgi:F-type H+-transporting ATPase subunit delta
MDRNRVTVRYAKALVELAIEKGILKEVDYDIRILFTSLKDYKGFYDLINSPEINFKNKIEAVEKLFSSEFQPLTMKFIHLVISKYREGYLIDICRNCIDMIRKMEGVVTAELTSAYELNSELIGQIKSKFEQKTKTSIEMTTNIDPEIIGGFIFTIDGEQYDASIASKLSSFKKQLQLK